MTANTDREAPTRMEDIRTSAWSARARATSATGWMMRYALDVEFLLNRIADRDVAVAVAKEAHVAGLRAALEVLQSMPGRPVESRWVIEDLIEEATK